MYDILLYLKLCQDLEIIIQIGLNNRKNKVLCFYLNKEDVMGAVRAYYDGQVFIPKSPVSAKINQEAIITFLETQPMDTSKKSRLLGLAGCISNEDYLELDKALEETEKVYFNEW